MLPILFKIGPLTVHTYGVAMAAAFLVGLLLIHHEAKRKGFNPEISFDIVLFAMIGGIIGARLVYVIDYWRDFVGNPAQVFAIWTGGLIFYGGLIGGTLAVLAVIKLRKLSVGKVADMVAPAMAVGSAIGRLGCYANGCCYGKETSSFLGVTFTDEIA
ncbi:MAG: prolipoprotein diacylglyceryl transferase, partial [Candidatus Aquicultor sp.]